MLNLVKAYFAVEPGQGLFPRSGLGTSSGLLNCLVCGIRGLGALVGLAAPRGLEAEKQRLEQELSTTRIVVDIQA